MQEILGLFKKETKKKIQGLKELRESLEKYLKENAEEVKQNLSLVFIEDSVEKLNITKRVEEVGVIISEFPLQKPFEIEKRLTAIANAYKVKTENGAIKELIEISGTSMESLINEIRKQIEYVGEGGEITKESVRALAIKTLDSNIFNLTDSLREERRRSSTKDFR